MNTLPERLNHLTIESGHTVPIPRGIVRDSSREALREPIRAALASGEAQQVGEDPLMLRGLQVWASEPSGAVGAARFDFTHPALSGPQRNVLVWEDALLPASLPTLGVEPDPAAGWAGIGEALPPRPLLLTSMAECLPVGPEGPHWIYTLGSAANVCAWCLLEHWEAIDPAEHLDGLDWSLLSGPIHTTHLDPHSLRLSGQRGIHPEDLE